MGKDILKRISEALEIPKHDEVDEQPIERFLKPYKCENNKCGNDKFNIYHVAGKVWTKCIKCGKVELQ